MQMKLKWILLCLFLSSQAVAQDKIVIDQVVAVIGNKMIKHSDVEAQLNAMRGEGELVNADSYCQVLEQLMVSKLYEHQAELDSIEIPDAAVEAELDRRIRHYSVQFGSREKLEEFYGKSVLAIKEEFRDMVRSQLVSKQMSDKIMEDVKVTPSEVRKFYEQINPDSIPLIPTEYEIYQIVKKPVISDVQKELTRAQLTEYRNRILKGERFATLARMYSADPGSSQKGGETGFFGRGEMFSEFESTAFSLKEGEISPVIETSAGFHILQLIERRGGNVNVRHLLLRPAVDVEELMRAQTFLDSVAKLIRDSVHTFQEAAMLFSDDPSGKAGGLYTSPMSGNARMTAEEMDQSIFFVIDRFEVGDISNASIFDTQESEQIPQRRGSEKAARIVMLSNRIPPHTANMNSDYDKIHNMAFFQAQQRTMSDWLDKKLESLYVRLNEKTKECTFIYPWGK